MQKTGLLAACLGIGVASILTLPADAMVPSHAIRLLGYNMRSNVLVLFSDAPLRTRLRKQTDRIVVELPGSPYFGPFSGMTAIPGTAVRGMEVETRGDQTRIVIDLLPGMTAPELHPRMTRVSTGLYRLALSLGPPPMTPRSPRPPLSSRPHLVAMATTPAAAPPAAPALVARDGGWVFTVPVPHAITFRAVPLVHSGRLMIDLYGASASLPPEALYRGAHFSVALLARKPASGDTRLIVRPSRPVRYAAALSNGRLTVAFAPNSIPERLLVERRITLDPGHGGSDPGAIGPDGVREKDVTLALANRLRQDMVAAGIDVQMTRTRDVDLDLHPRVDIGDAFGSDVFISIHANAIPNPAVRGIQTYYYNSDSERLATLIQHSLVTRLKAPDRGVHRDNFVVVKYNRMPACLVEIGYITNPKEELLIESAGYQEKAARAILAGVQTYFKAQGRKL